MTSTALKHPGVVLTTLSLGMLVVSLDATIVNVALPSLAAGLDGDMDNVLWVVNGYVLVNAALLVTGGRLGDVLGARRMFLVGLVGFLVASALCGVSENVTQLVLARFLQGVTGALLVPQVMTLISDIFPAERRGAAMGVMTGTIGISAMSGPVLGGLILHDWSWRWIFYINVPVCTAAIVLTLLFVPDARPANRHKFDLMGVFLVTAGLGAITYGLIEGQRYDWGQVTGVISIPAILVAGALILVAFVWWERRYPEPLLPLNLFRYRAFTVATLLNSVMYLTMYGVTLLVTLHLQSVSGHSALRTGLTYVPMALAMGIFAAVAGRLTDRTGARYLIFGGTLVLAAGFGAMAVVESATSTSTDFLLPLFVVGIGVAFIMAPATTEAMMDLPERLVAAASGVFNSSRQMMGALSIAVVGAALSTGLAHQITPEAERVARQLPPEQRARFVSELSKAVGEGGFASGQQAGPGGDAGLVQRLTHDAYSAAFAAAERPTLYMLIILLLVVAPTFLLLPRRAKAAKAATTAEAAEAMPPRQQQDPVG
ncbi:DHA2 family efflux MFS transporter permease subunit [Actinomadura decatromicini]|uniref:DHA2 family efflux MFS transporter permease subunit n=1 Tax=Actinomadura decatromicini TaxID=2604572 RepID=A0A5D3FWK0_9ACTN|nr:DHA2 family efflux MFS transporter permease subunit [Actinomadura decatromicini]TYK52504.1 DHA2 family efflux MFS transporter permease subunit [Actinomadura decatromicini]